MKVKYSGNNGWYVVRGTVPREQYLAKDGNWYGTCGDKGFYDTREKAREALRQYKSQPSDGPRVKPKEKETMQAPYNISDVAISVFFNSKMYQVPRTDARYDRLKEHLLKPHHDEKILEEILDMGKSIERITEGLVKAGKGEVTYNGLPVHNAVVDKLLEMMEEGVHAHRWAKFLNNLMENPSHRSVTQLYDFLGKFHTPITEDGCFLAFKGVRNNYTDHYTGKFDNSIGKVVEMPRNQVDCNPDNTCSTGLHVCASEYLGGGMFSGERIVVVKVNPRDVVSIPKDYNLSKMRICRYEVIDELKDKSKASMDKYTSSYYSA